MPLPYAMSPAGTPEPTAVLEALLFLSGQPLSVAELTAHTGWDEEKIEQTAQTLAGVLREEKRGLCLLRVAGGYQLVVRPELYETVQWVHTRTTELSTTALEVLAIIAFKQPVTRAEIEKIRGVSSERLIASLLQQGLIQDLGRKDSPGRPILYGTSAYFLECMGVDSLSELAEKMPQELQPQAGTETQTATTLTTEEQDERTIAKSNA